MDALEAGSIRFETGGREVLKVQQMEVRSTGLRVSPPEFLYTNLSV